MTSRNRGYYLDKAINAVKEYIKKKDGIDLKKEDRSKYWPILTKDKRFHVFACFRYGLIIDYDNHTNELEINEVKDSRGRNYSKNELVFLKASVDRLGSLKEFLKMYSEFKTQHTHIKEIQELNDEFRKEFGIPTVIPIPADLNDLINSE
jgi:hypothetical protein